MNLSARYSVYGCLTLVAAALAAVAAVPMADGWTDLEFIIPFPNKAPVIEPIDDIVVTARERVKFQVEVDDEYTFDGGMRHFILGPLPPGVNDTRDILGWSTGEFEWKPHRHQVGVHRITIGAWDGYPADRSGHAVPQSFTITVLDNPPPVIEPIEDITVYAGQTVSFYIDATDVDSRSYLQYYAKQPLPPGVGGGRELIDQNTGHFEWTPGRDQIGVHTINLLVWDGYSYRPHGRTYESFTITVMADPPPVVKPVDDITVSAGQEVFFRVNATDVAIPDSRGLNYILLDPLPTGENNTNDMLNWRSGYFRWTPDDDQRGVHTLNLRVWDGQWRPHGRTDQSFTIAVNGHVLAGFPTGITIPEHKEYTFDAGFVAGISGHTFGLQDAPDGARIDPATGVFRWTPSEEQGGAVYDFTVTALDADGATVEEQKATFTVAESNLSPAIEPIEDIVATVGTEVSFFVSATDMDTDGNLQYIAVPPLPQGVADSGEILDRNTGHFSWTPDRRHIGANPINLRVWDGLPGNDGYAHQSLTITVNGVALGMIPASVTIREQVEYTFDANFTEGISGHTFGLQDAPRGAEIDPATGVFRWTPSESQGRNTYTFRITAVDGDGVMADEHEMTIRVTEYNAPPVVKPVENVVVATGETVSLYVRSTDTDTHGGLRHLLLDPFPPGVGYGGNILDRTTGHFEWTPNKPGVYPINLRVWDGQDGGRGNTYVSFNITAVANPVPVIEPIDDIVVPAGQRISFYINATDEDTIGSLRYILRDPLPTGVADGREILDRSTGHFDWTPGEDQAGVHNIRLRVWDGQDGYHGRAHYGFKITVHGSILGAMPTGITIPEHAEYAFVARFADGADVRGHTFGLLDAPDGARIDPATGRFSWTPSESQGGNTHTFRVTALDGDGAVAGEHIVIITVTEANAIPVINPIDDITVSANQEISFYVNVVDTDGINDMRYFLDPPLPPGASNSSEILDQSTGQFAWTPTENHTGVYPINLRVWDGQSDLKGNASQSFTITVLDNPPPVIDLIDDIVVSAGQRVAFQVFAADRDTIGGLRYIVLDPLPSGVADGRDILGWNSGYFNWVPDGDQTGVHTINLRVWDGQPGQHGRAHASFTITVNGPVLAAIPTGITILEQVEYTFDADLTEGANVPGHAFGMTGGPDGAVIHPATGYFRWTPSESQGGQTHAFTVTVMDGAGDTIDGQDVTITVNQNPEFDIAEIARTVYRGASFELDLNATDDDVPKQKLTCRITSQETGTVPAGIDPQTCVIRWIPADFGDHVIRVQADDDHGGTTHTAIRLNVMFNDTQTPVITLNNATQNPQIVELGDGYEELGATAADDDPRYDGTVTADASAVDSSRAGTYTVTYTAPADPAGKTPVPVTRNVTVQDTTKPVIMLNGTSMQTVDFGQTYEELGATVTDNDPRYAGTVTITAPEIDSGVEGATYTVTYSAPADQAGNAPDNRTRTVTIGAQFAEPNVNPVAQDATLNITEDSGVATVMPGISDPDNGTLEIISVGTPSRGTAGFDPSTNTVTYMPGQDEYGRDSFDYTVQDNRLGTDTGTIHVTITPVNDPPEIELIAGIVTDELVLRTVILNATDVDNTTESLTWMATGAPAGLDITGNLLTWTPSESQGPDYYSFAVTVSDGAGTDSQLVRFTVNEVNQDPVLHQGNVTAAVNASRTFKIGATDADIPQQPLTYRFETGSAVPPGATLNGTTGIFSWTPAVEHLGTVHTVAVTVTDGLGGSATGSFTVTVQQYRGPLMLGEIGNRTIPEMQELAIMLNATGADAGGLTYAATGAPAGLDITGNRLTWTPAEDQGGRDHTFVVTVSDGTDTDSQTVTFAVTETNQNPVLAAINDRVVEAGAMLVIDTDARDGDIPEQTLVYNMTGHPAGATISGQGMFEWMPTAGQIDNYTITITVSDGQGGSASQTFNVNVTDVITAPPPVSRPNPDLVVPDILINAELHFPSAVTPAVADPAGGNVTITGVTGATLGILDDSMLPQISYTPNQTGIDILTYTVSDERNGTANATISIFISPEGNARPALDHIYNTGGRVGVDLEFTATADDSDDTSLTFDIANVPDGASITAGGDFSWRPAESQNGTHTVTFIVHDDSGGADWQHVLITILRADETNLPPVPQDIEAGVVLGGGRGFQPDISDPENDGTEITRVYDSSLGDVDRSFLSQGIIVYVAGVLGDDEVVYTVSDGRGGFANGTISITVEEPANVRPLIEFVGDKSVNAGNELTFTVDADDLDGLVVDFGLEGDTQGPSISPQGVFSWTPTANDVGRHQFTILVFDDAGENSTVSITVTVRPSDFENSPPVAPDVVIMTSQDVLSISRPTLTDPDEGDPVRITQTGDTTKGRILSGFLRAGIIIYLPNQGETGTETIPYTIADSSDGNDTAAINVFISARGNTDPILGSIDFRNINAGNPLAFDLEAEDPDGDTISYLLVGAPDNIVISPEGAFSWTPTAANVGNHTFTIVAYDDRGGADSKTAVIRVLPAGTVNQAPNAPDSTVTVAPGGSVVITPAISDPDGDRVAITNAVASGTGVVIQSEDSMNYIHVATAPTETITYTVTDARGATATGTITITIR